MDNAKIKNDARTVKYYPCKRYATDVTFKQSSIPSENMAEGDKYSTGKHVRYGYKIGILVLPFGICIGCTTHFRGSVSDLDIFCGNHNSHAESSKKDVWDLDIFDDGLLQVMATDVRVVLTNKDHKEATESYWVINSIKNYQNLS